MYTPLYHFPPYVFTTFPPLGLFPSQMVHLVPVPNMERAMYPF